MTTNVSNAKIDVTVTGDIARMYNLERSKILSEASRRVSVYNTLQLELTKLHVDYSRVVLEYAYTFLKGWVDSYVNRLQELSWEEGCGGGKSLKVPSDSSWLNAEIPNIYNASLEQLGILDPENHWGSAFKGSYYKLYEYFNGLHTEEVHDTIAILTSSPEFLLHYRTELDRLIVDESRLRRAVIASLEERIARLIDGWEIIDKPTGLRILR